MEHPIKIEIITAEDVLKELYHALQVFRLDPKHKKRLEEEDPQALKQATQAIESYNKLVMVGRPS